MPKTKTSRLRQVRRYKKREDPITDIGSEIASREEVSDLIPQNEDKITRWKRMMDVGGDINLVFLRILEEIENNILEHLSDLEENLMNLLETKSSDNENKNFFKMYTSTYVKKLKETLEQNFPINDLETFKTFDEDLQDDVKKLNALRQFFHFLIDGNKGVKTDIYTILNAMMTPTVQQYYTAVGKAYRGNKKENFSATNIYLCMQDVLIDKHKQSAVDLNIKTIVSLWFSRVVDRMGLRQRPRQLKKNESVSSESESE